MAYSKELEALLKKAKAKPGDKIRVSVGGKTFEGVLLPRPELGGENSNLIVRLANGYNAGVAFAKGMAVEKAGEAVKLESFPKLAVEKRNDLPNISLIATGGTISSRVDYKTGGVYMLMSPEEILATVPELADVVSFKSILSPFRKASEDMDHRDWGELAKETANELNGGADGVIVTHGTDTLGYTAAALSFMLRGLEKPVALVGAQRSPDRGSFDGAMNLLCAARYAAGDVAEVAVVMHGSPNDDYCFANVGTKVRKMHSARRDAFRPVNCRPIEKIWPGGKHELLWTDFTRRGAGKVEADVKFEEKVALLKAHPGADPALLDFLVGKNFRGVVLEGTGLGHFAVSSDRRNWMKSLKDAVGAGVSVCMTTQCLYGRVHESVYANLRKVSAAGVVFCEDMLPETAFVKLGWVLGHEKRQDKAREMMLKNYAHEINGRLTEEDFLV